MSSDKASMLVLFRDLEVLREVRNYVSSEICKESQDRVQGQLLEAHFLLLSINLRTDLAK